jgi:RNA polymerase sigma-70 factor (ECF subfamily)
MASEERDEMSFEDHRSRLWAIAYRLLGSRADADDAVQETWLRFSRTDTSDVENLGAWLSTVVSRVCLNMLQGRKTRPQPVAEVPEATSDDDPAYEALHAGSVGLALQVVLDALTPAERVAFVLHDIFAVPFDQIAPIVDRSTPATRQLASRARTRVQHRDAAGATDRLRQAALVDAFLAAARDGNFEALVALLHPDVVLRADDAVMALGAPAEMRGRDAVGAFSRRARGGTPALLDGAAALVWLVDDAPKVVYRFTTAGDQIVAIDLIGDARDLDLVIQRT